MGYLDSGVRTCKFSMENNREMSICGKFVDINNVVGFLQRFYRLLTSVFVLYDSMTYDG